MSEKKPLIYTNKEIVLELRKINKRFDEKAIEIKTPSRFNSLLIISIILFGLCLTVSGLGTYNDWDWKITTGLIILLLGVFIAITREN